MTLRSLMAGPSPALIHRVLPRPDEAQQLAAPSQAEDEGGGDLDFAELTFAEAFGPISEAARAGQGGPGDDPDGASPSGRGRYLDAAEDEEAEAQRLQDWAPPGSIPDGDLPFVICHRAHSMVGPALTPRHSFARGSGPREWAGSKEEDPSPLGLACEAPAQPGGRGEQGAPPHVGAGGPEELEARAGDRTGQGHGTSKENGASAGTATGSGGVPALGEPGGLGGAKVGPESFELLRVVGQGAFGKVFQVEHKETGDILAMKVMRKDRILERNQGDYMQAERDILTRVVHPFIVQLQYSFQTSSKLYLLLDFINGGHLFFQLYRQGTFSEDLARIYAAELVLAVGHLHSMGIMHRDLKPENILLDSDGHIKLTDFGLAKEFQSHDKSNSLCGTMEYMAPEIIQAKGHGPAADFWSIGVLIFEMVTGQPPFSCNNRQKLQQKIIKDKIKFPTFLTSEAHSMLKGLLQKDPSKRLGSGPGGVEELKAHKWFRNIHWGKLLGKEIQPKFRPTVNGKQCTANFDEMWTKLPANDSPAGTPPSLDLSVFRNYSYVAPHKSLPTVESDSDGEAPSGSESPEEDAAEESDGEEGLGEH